MGRRARSTLHGVPLGLAADTVELVPYDDRWTALFECEAALLRSGLQGQVGRIAHVGSTAIAGMDAKSILDRMADDPSWWAPALLHSRRSRSGPRRSGALRQDEALRQ